MNASQRLLARVRSLRAPRGVAMIMTLVVMASLLLGGLVATGMRMATLRGTGQTLIGDQSYSCAEAGIVAARNYFRANSASWNTYLPNSAWTTPPGFPTAAGFPAASPNYQVTISNDVDSFPLPTPNVDHNGTIILTSTCVDGYNGNAGTLNNPVTISRYLTIMPLVNTGTTNFNPGAVTYSTTNDFTGGAGVNAQGGINGYSGNVAGGGGGPAGSQVAAVYTNSGVAANGVTLANNQIALSTVADSYSFIWIANTTDGTVSKIDTQLYKEVARFYTAPQGTSPLPQTTAVDLQGNAWVANSANNTVTKIGLLELGNCIDRNGDGVIETIQNGNPTAPITPSNWTGALGTVTGAVDECILGNIPLTASGVPTPSGVSSLAIDANNFIYAGSLKPNAALYRLSTLTSPPTAAAITNAISLNSYQGVYSAVVDSSGYLWATDSASSTIMKVNISTTPMAYVTTFSVGFPAFAIAIDPSERLWVDSAASSSFASISTPDTTPTKAAYTRASGKTSAGGITADSNNNVWIAGGTTDKVVERYTQSGSYVTSITVGNGPTGVSVDASGDVWTPNNADNTAARINPATNTLPNAALAIGKGPNDIGDMTGTLARGATVRVGTWSVRQNCGLGCTSWESVSWTATQPAGTGITVQARFANSVAELSNSPWIAVANGAIWPQGTETGAIIEVVFTLTSNSTATTPVIHNVTITPWLSWSPPPATPNWSTGFESGQAQATTPATYTSTLNETGATCAEETTLVHTGLEALQLSATAGPAASSSNVYCQWQGVPSPAFTITSGMKLRYWIYHTGVPTAAIDGKLSGGQYLHQTAVTDSAGISINPQSRQDLMGQWYYVQVDLTSLAGQSFTSLILAYDTGTGGPYSTYTGAVTAVVDDISFGQ